MMDTSQQSLYKTARETTYEQWRENLKGFCLKQKQIMWQVWLTANGKSQLNNGYKGPI